jgi:nitrogen fixation NifU-like protein
MSHGQPDRREEEEIYQDHVLDHYEDPYHRGHSPHATHAHEDDNPLCGDVVRVELVVDGDRRVREAWFDGDGCCISQSAASMLMEKIEGKTLDEVQQFTADDMLQLFGVRLTPNRQKCCLLSWRVLRSAVFAPLHDTDGAAEPRFQGPDLGEES